MPRQVVLNELRVQEIERAGGRWAYTLLWPDGSVHREGDLFLRTLAPGTDRTYAYLLVDHLRWLEREALTSATVSFGDLQRYMAALGAQFHGPYGLPWRVGKRPYGDAALATAAACLKSFYLCVAATGINEELGKRLSQVRLPRNADRQRALLGHASGSLPANPLAPSGCGDGIRRCCQIGPDPC